MLLTTFLDELLTTGAVTLAGQPAPFAAADEQAAQARLRELHARDALHLPHAAPAFEGPAASWAAAYVYRAAQLILVRELDEAAIRQWLPAWPGTLTPAAVYAADLTLRYLPDLLALARGLAPGDALVAHLHATGQGWPLSFAGAPAALGPSPAPEPAAEAMVLSHPALCQAYLDRLIAARQLGPALRPALRPLVQAALGDYAPTLWPEFAAALAEEGCPR